MICFKKLKLLLLIKSSYFPFCLFTFNLSTHVHDLNSIFHNIVVFIVYIVVSGENSVTVILSQASIFIQTSPIIKLFLIIFSMTRLRQAKQSAQFT